MRINGTNDVPVANADAGTAREKGGLDNAIAGFDATGNALTNDTDVDASDTKTVVTIQAGTGTAVAVPAASTGEDGYIEVDGLYGTLRIGADGIYRYLVDEANATVQALRTEANTVQDVFTYLTHVCELMENAPAVHHYVLHFTMNCNSPTEEN